MANRAKAKLGVGIHGAGWVSSEHIRAFTNNKECEVVAICSRRESSARGKADEAGLECSIYTDYRQLLDDPSVDIVVICTPSNLHAQETILAAKANKHLLIEKPVALNLRDLKKMSEAVDEASVKTVVGFVLHWNPLFDTIKALIADGAIGKIHYAEVDYYHGIGPWYGQFAWNIKKEGGGSSLLSAGCHALDGLRYFVQQEATEVASFSTKSCCQDFQPYEYDSTSVTIIKFANGSVGKVASLIDCKMPYVFNIMLCGSEGTIRNNQIHSTKKYPGLLKDRWVTIPTILPDSGDVTHHPFQGEIDHLIDCILSDRESSLNLADAYKTHEIIFAADKSAKTGKPIRLPLK
ncbi:MAG: hypothetical protein AUJ92_09165 [Armatimonadetes bacterium CG2_30_59_28]|nr:Gfo/Idh/MocA family oxidoreductase [Armatimonadota bacterium]OIO94869.1 MAG: hypothetical protein AUJ92_09165 [Armatimonadetes bacterium CG2_30_59_28]PIU65913.1 MAG: gfo/Idh/MocA family oxidoreductase [Armatimonadetes bacterium CG07_land_8_20_14_0_80_59_28]PIY48269.1 MAG: gfo/Idh/MocA family oxidoreductase [Armatimonadetes bacterium CG_4_10_14_3_um_filter_59_10]PJB63477.1 MAG: gfo/Idh/MocA family oxidoreductase [Armatimonadetes bacterium CG_4_9_14_3_um_filter_58_7]